jgi:hypothetical protein
MPLLLLLLLQVLVQLCFCLPPPACYVYRDMRAGTMQGVLAQRAMLEKAVRAGLVELEWQARRLRGWLDTVSRFCSRRWLSYRQWQK